MGVLVRYSAVISFLCLTGALSLAQPIAVVLPDISKQDRANLLAGQQIFEEVKPDGPVKVAPAGALGEPLCSLASTPGYSIIVQSAFLIKGASFSNADRLVLFNKLLKIESLSGVTYYSETRKKITVLFDNVFRVEKPGSRDPVPAQNFETLPPLYQMTVHIKDVNFGSTWYALTIELNSSSIVITLENVKPLGIMMIRAFDTSGIRMRFMAIPVDEGLLVSGVCAANPSGTALHFVDMFSAIQKRVMAVEGWVLKQVGH